ncbi:MAG: Flp pilus assembly protein CpaB [Actinomycetota bacterium]
MRRKRPFSSKALFALSLVLAVGTTLLLRDRLGRLEAAAATAGPGSSMVVAATDLSRGTVLDPNDLATVKMPQRYLPPGALSSVDQAAGRILSADVVSGEAVTAARLAATGGPTASMVPAGLRAAPVQVAAPPGLLAPGDRVDVLATFAAGQPHTETVVSGAEVLSILSGGIEGFEGASTVVLLVSPDTAEQLAYARAFADLSVTVTSAAGA